MKKEQIVTRQCNKCGSKYCTRNPTKELFCDICSGVLKSHDPVSHPSHYTSHPSGVECIQITRHMNFCLGNAVKYIWRAGLKGDEIEDLKKAAWYLNDEIERRNNAQPYNKT